MDLGFSGIKTSVMSAYSNWPASIQALKRKKKSSEKRTLKVKKKEEKKKKKTTECPNIS